MSVNLLINKRRIKKMDELQPSNKIKIEFEKNSLWKVATLVLGVLLVAFIVTDGFTGKTVAPVIEDNNIAPDKPAPVKLDIGNDYVRGDKNAPVTIFEFSDFQCPYCGRYFSQAYGLIKAKYIDTGKVRYVFKDFPLSFHEKAIDAAKAANAAGDQGKYWEMHDILFSKQAEWSSNPGYLTLFEGYAEELELDVEQFKSDLGSDKYATEINADFQEGVVAGVKGTPAFFINGELISGAQPYAVFEAAIEKALAA